MALTYSSLFVGFGIIWIPVAFLLMAKAQERWQKAKALLWCAFGWITSVSVFIAWGSWECWYRGGCGN